MASTRLRGVLFFLVGGGLAAGFGALAVHSAQKLSSYPPHPASLGVADAARLELAPPGSWVKLHDAVVDCSREQVQPGGGPYYTLLADPSGQEHVVVASDEKLSCEELKARDWVGGLSVRQATGGGWRQRLPEGLGWSDVDWSQWPRGRVVILWTSQGPRDSAIGVWLGAGLALLGTLIGANGLLSMWRRPRDPDRVLAAGAPVPATCRLTPDTLRHQWRAALVMLGAGAAWALFWSGLAWLLGEGRGTALPLVAGMGVLSMLFGLLALGRGFALARQLRRDAELVWLPVRSVTLHRARGIRTGAATYELDVPRESFQSVSDDELPPTVQITRGPLEPGIVFRDETRSAALAARLPGGVGPVVIRADLRELDATVRAALKQG